MFKDLTPLPEAIEIFRTGGFIALLDHPEREGEADLIIAAQHITGAKLNYMVTHCRGLVTVPMLARRLQELDIRIIEPRFCGENVPAFTEPVDYNPTSTTGISAFERAATIRALLDPSVQASDFMRPGHVFPLAAAEGGLRERTGHTEGAMTLAELAGLYPAVVMCEVMQADGNMAHGQQIYDFAKERNIALVSVPQLVEYLK